MARLIQGNERFCRGQSRGFGFTRETLAEPALTDLLLGFKLARTKQKRCPSLRPMDAAGGRFGLLMSCTSPGPDGTGGGEARDVLR